MLKDLFAHIGDLFIELFSKEETWIILLMVGVAGTAVSVALPELNFEEAFLNFMAATWWAWAFAILAITFEGAWLFWRQEIFKSEIEWEVLQIVIPREHLKTPKAMEQVFRAMHSLTNAPDNIQEKYWDGEVTRWYSIEVVTFAGEISFYIRFYKKQRDLVEAAFFAHYPDVELVETEDYMPQLPQTLEEMYEQGRDMWGTELALEKDPAYPIVSYASFIHEQEEERQTDPFSAIMEVLGKCKPGQFSGIQLVFQGAPDSWRKGGEEIIEKLKEKTGKKVFLEESEEGQSFGTRTPGETDTIKAVEENITKPAFKIIIRYIYISPKEIYYDSYPRRGLRGAFQQYNSLGLNAFKDNVRTSTRTMVWYWPHLFPKRRAELRKKRMLHSYLTRDMPYDTWFGKLITSHPLNWNNASETIILNTESFATIFHPPTVVVTTTPHTRQRESRRAGPPAGIPIFGSDEEIEKYQ
jgi:hypothetical protein